MYSSEIDRLDFEIQNWDLADSEIVRRQRRIREIEREQERVELVDTNDVHIATRWVDGVRYRYALEMTDRMFQASVLNILEEYEINGLSGWVFVHIPTQEWIEDSPRKKIVMALPVMTGILDEELIHDILVQHPNHEPCAWCADHMEAPPRGHLCTGYRPAYTIGYGERGRVWNGYLCEQCAEEVQSLKWKS